MNPAESELWQRIVSFAFDEPGASWPFSARLANENRWTPAFTARAIEEYRRFAFLAVTGTDPASPSDIVDQVWHEHLVYTRNYWEEFCAKTLQRRLHHEPTRGGENERAKFDRWYARTLERYRNYFGEPPHDIWPTPADRAVEKTERVSVDVSRHWVIRKWGRQNAAWALAACVPFAFLGCASIASGSYNPLDWMGPDFLRLWYPLAILLAIVALRLRSSLRAGSTTAFRLTDPVDIAFLAGGSNRVIQSTVAGLLRRGALELVDGALQVKAPLPASASTVERRIYAACEKGAVGRVATLEPHIAAEINARQQKLAQAGLLVDDHMASTIRLSVLSCMGAPLLLGLAKIFVGLERDRPVGFLVIGMVLAIIVTGFLLRRPRRTRAGFAALDALYEEHEDLDAVSLETRRPTDATSACIAVALYGVTVLPALGMTDLRTFIAPISNTTTTGCSGSSCGGGGGGGCGGGGGGGGCGGCGGH